MAGVVGNYEDVEGKGRWRRVLWVMTRMWTERAIMGVGVADGDKDALFSLLCCSY